MRLVRQHLWTGVFKLNLSDQKAFSCLRSLKELLKLQFTVETLIKPNSSKPFREFFKKFLKEGYIECLASAIQDHYLVSYSRGRLYFNLSVSILLFVLDITSLSSLTVYPVLNIPHGFTVIHCVQNLISSFLSVHVPISFCLLQSN